MIKRLAGFVVLAGTLCAQTPAPPIVHDAAPTIDSLTTQLAAARRKLVDWGGLNFYGSEDTEIPAPKPGENRVVFIGDSITANWGKGKTPFFPGKPYINRGIPLQVTPQMLVRFRQDVIDLQPKVVVIQTGLSDIGMVMGPGSEGTIQEHLLSMIDLAKAHGIKVVLASLTPICNCYHQETTLRPVGKIAAINGTMRDIVKDTGSIYLNYYSVLVDTPAGTRQLKKELTDDGLGPNDAGYALMAPLAEKAIADALASK